MSAYTLTSDLCYRMDSDWRSVNYILVGQIYLYDNPLLHRAGALANVDYMDFGQLGTTRGQHFVCVHLTLLIAKYILDMTYVYGLGHGGRTVVAITYLEGAELGYKDEGTIATPFDMTLLNDLEHFQLTMGALDRPRQIGDKGLALKCRPKEKLIAGWQYFRPRGQDMPKVRCWPSKCKTRT